MAKRGRHPHNRRRQTARDKRRRQARPGRGPGPADLLSTVAQRLASGEPLDFLDYVSNLLTAVDSRGQNPFGHERSGGPECPTLSELLESFTGIVLAETTALLAALAELGPDELTRARPGGRWRCGRIRYRTGWPGSARPRSTARRRARMCSATGTACCSARGCPAMS